MTPFEAFSLLFAIAAFAVSLVTYYYSDRRMRTANKLTAAANKKIEESNVKMDKANQIALDAYKLTLREHKWKAIPILEFKYDFFMFYPHPDETDTDDYIRFILENTTFSEAKIDSIDPLSSYKLSTELGDEITYPFTIGYNEPVILFIRFSHALKKSFHYQGEDVRRKFEDHIIKCNVVVKYRDEFNTKYETVLQYDSSQAKHVGKPMRKSKNYFSFRNLSRSKHLFSSFFFPLLRCCGVIPSLVKEL